MTAQKYVIFFGVNSSLTEIHCFTSGSLLTVFYKSVEYDRPGECSPV